MKTKERRPCLCTSSSMPTAYERASLRTFDGLSLFAQHWRPAGDLRGTVLLSHGLGEHSGRYAAVAQALAGRGYATYAYDHRGHGASQGPRAFVRRFDEYVADLHEAYRHAGKRAGGRPLFLMGHSMGGAVAALYVLEHRPALDGLILSSPAIRPHGDLSPLLRRVAQPLSRVAPHLPTPPLDVEALSRDPAVVQAFRDDPLCYKGPVKARLGAEIMHAGQRIRSRMDLLEVPLLILQGTADALVDADATTALYHCARSEDKTLRRYEGFYHETFREPQGDRVLTDLLSWLDDRS